jgi:hypothetical protein
MTVLRWLVALCFFADLLFPPCLAVYALIRWQGRWRNLAAAPLLVVVPAAVSFLYLRQGQAAKGSLWLLLYVPLTLVVCTYSLAVAMLHSKSKPPRP